MKHRSIRTTQFNGDVCTAWLFGPQWTGRNDQAASGDLKQVFDLREQVHSVLPNV
ncbi:hypothetical protein [Viridibacterium curvum]|uniref:hypothetical protein n=1 Tax=Viridibacterium curvum TaxID=1101404 RepID=UPI0031F0181B